LLGIVGGIALPILALIGTIAVYDALADDNMMSGMWDRRTI